MPNTVSRMTRWRDFASIGLMGMIAVAIVVPLRGLGWGILIAGEMAFVIQAATGAVIHGQVARRYPQASRYPDGRLLIGPVADIQLTVFAVGAAIWGLVAADWEIVSVFVAAAAVFAVITVWSFVPVRRTERTGEPGRNGRQGIWWW